MTSAKPTAFDDLVATLSKLGAVTVVDPTVRQLFRERADRLMSVELNRDSISNSVRNDPELVPLLGLVVGLSQESLKNTLRVRLGSAGWTELARKRPSDVIAMLDDEFQLLERLGEDRATNWEYGDILLERAGPRGGAGRAIGRGRALEDAVEKLVGKDGLDLPHQVRTSFVGTGGRIAPCDIAIPAGGETTQIAIAIKGFNSTGSKLTDATREIQAMAEVRQPRQFIYAVVDGIGWLGRKADLRRIHDLSRSRRIDGLYTLALLGQFQTELSSAARRAGLLP